MIFTLQSHYTIWNKNQNIEFEQNDEIGYCLFVCNRGFIKVDCEKSLAFTFANNGTFYNLCKACLIAENAIFMLMMTKWQRHCWYRCSPPPGGWWATLVASMAMSSSTCQLEVSILYFDILVNLPIAGHGASMMYLCFTEIAYCWHHFTTNMYWLQWIAIGSGVQSIAHLNAQIQLCWKKIFM